jgi:hypothetical protein
MKSIFQRLNESQHVGNPNKHSEPTQHLVPLNEMQVEQALLQFLSDWIIQNVSWENYVTEGNFLLPPWKKTWALS